MTSSIGFIVKKTLTELSLNQTAIQDNYFSDNFIIDQLKVVEVIMIGQF